jgi:hypothetical protein
MQACEQAHASKEGALRAPVLRLLLQLLHRRLQLRIALLHPLFCLLPAFLLLLCITTWTEAGIRDHPGGTDGGLLDGSQLLG